MNRIKRLSRLERLSILSFTFELDEIDGLDGDANITFDITKAIPPTKDTVTGPGEGAEIEYKISSISYIPLVKEYNMGAGGQLDFEKETHLFKPEDNPQVWAAVVATASRKPYADYIHEKAKETLDTHYQRD